MYTEQKYELPNMTAWSRRSDEPISHCWTNQIRIQIDFGRCRQAGNQSSSWGQDVHALVTERRDRDGARRHQRRDLRHMQGRQTTREGVEITSHERMPIRQGQRRCQRQMTVRPP